jgi:hypothetical protein
MEEPPREVVSSQWFIVFAKARGVKWRFQSDVPFSKSS